MIMNGGSINDNAVLGGTNSDCGGGIWAYRESNSFSVTVTIKKGAIANNTAPTGPNTYAGIGAQIIDQRT